MGKSGKLMVHSSRNRRRGLAACSFIISLTSDVSTNFLSWDILSAATSRRMKWISPSEEQVLTICNFFICSKSLIYSGLLFRVSEYTSLMKAEFILLIAMEAHICAKHLKYVWSSPGEIRTLVKGSRGPYAWPLHHRAVINTKTMFAVITIALSK